MAYLKFYGLWLGMTVALTAGMSWLMRKFR